MSKPISIWWMLVWLCLTGCGGAAYKSNTTKLAHSDGLNVFFSPQLFSSSVSLVQQVVFQKGVDKFEFMVMVDANEESIAIAGLSPLGKRQFLMTVDPKHFFYEAEMLFELPFPPKYLVRDFLLVFGNIQVLQRQMANADVKESGNERVFGFKTDIVRISYSSVSSEDCFLLGDVMIVHLEEGYTVKISTVQVERHGKK